MIVKNKYNLEIPIDLLNKYVESLKGKLFKCLPIYENRNIRTKQIESQDTGYEQYQKYVQNLMMEISGAFYSFDDTVRFLELLHLIESMQLIQKNEHKKLKSLVFHCISVCDKLKIKDGGDS